MRATLSADKTQANAYWRETAQNRMLLVVLGMIVLVPLLAVPSNNAMQNIAEKALQFMAALLIGLLVLRARPPANSGDVLVFLGTGANLAVLLYFAWTILVLLLGPQAPRIHRLSVAVLQQTLAGILLYFALAYHVRQSRHLDKITDALVYVAGIFSLAHLSMLGLQGSAELFGNHQLYGGFLMILLPVALVSALTAHELKRKIAYQVCAVLTVVSVIMSGLRSAWFGTLVMLLVLIIFSCIGSRRRNRIKKWKSQYLISIITLMACCAFAAMQSDLGETIQQRIAAGSHTFHERQQFWYAAEQLIINKPVFGTGLGTFPVYQYPYSLSGREGALVLQTGPALSEMAHNFWLQTAAEQGLIGMALFASILVTFWAAGIRCLRTTLHSGIRRTLLLATMAGVVGFAVDCLSNPAWQFSQVNIYLWLMLGLGVACMQPRPSLYAPVEE